MPNPLILNPNDNIAVLCSRTEAGEDVLKTGHALESALNAGHKIARTDIKAGSAVRKFGQFIGTATVDIAAGSHVHTHNCTFSSHEKNYEIGADISQSSDPDSGVEPLQFKGYRRPDGRTGTRNFIAILATVNCSATVIRKAAQEITQEGLLAGFANIDGVIALSHGTGCGMASEGPGFDLLDRVLWGYAAHPNVGAAVFVGLGCEVFHIARMQSRLGATATPRFRALTIQDTGGTRATIDAIKKHILEIAPEVNAIHRQDVPISELTVALQCGGSDGMSSITANPALGYASDLVVGMGGTVVLSETPEIYGAENLLLRRAAGPDVAKKLLIKIEWWEKYTALFGGSMDNNPSPGNKLGGITTILEKSLGAVAKSGSSPLNDVFDYGEAISTKGFVFMDSPGYDPVSVTGQIAGGAQIVVFTTGRGSAFGSKPAPTIKLATNDGLYQKMKDDMDINCGDVISSGVSLQEKGHEILHEIIAAASGQKTKSEALGLGDNEFVPWQIGAVV